MRLIVYACTAIFLCTPASFANDALLEAALDAAETRPEDVGRWAFTLSYAGSEGRLTARFDPREPEDERWSVLDVETDLSERELKLVLADLAEEVDADLDQLVDEPRQAISGDVRFIEQTDTLARYAFAPTQDFLSDGDDDADGMAEHLVAEASITVAEPEIRSVRIFAPKPFKPDWRVKLSALDVTLDFARPAPDAPLFVVSERTHVKGRAIGVIRFDETETLTYSNFEQVIAPGLSVMPVNAAE